MLPDVSMMNRMLGREGAAATAAPTNSSVSSAPAGALESSTTAVAAASWASDRILEVVMTCSSVRLRRRLES